MQENQLTCNKVRLARKTKLIDDTNASHPNPAEVITKIVSDSRKYISTSTCDGSIDGNNNFRTKYGGQQNNSFIAAEIRINKNKSYSSSDDDGSVSIIMQGKPLGKSSNKTDSAVTAGTKSSNTSKGKTSVPHEQQAMHAMPLHLEQHVGSQMLASKPVIITSANTNKQVKLQHRSRKLHKNVDVPKVGKSKKGERRKSNVSDAENNKTPDKTNQRMLIPETASTLNLRPSTTDIGKSLEDRLKSFARMDVEFYDIINKMDEANERRNSILPGDATLPEVVRSKPVEGNYGDECITETETKDNSLSINVPIIDTSQNEVVSNEAEPGSVLQSFSDEHYTASNVSRLNVSNIHFLGNDSISLPSMSRGNSALPSSSRGNSSIRKSMLLAPEPVPKKKGLESRFEHSIQSNDRKKLASSMHDGANTVLNVVGRNEKMTEFPHDISNDELVHSYNSNRSGFSVSHRTTSPSSLDIREALNIMQISVNVSNEDIIHISASKAPLEERIVQGSTARRGIRPRGKPAVNTVHLFCTSYPEDELDLHSKMLSRYSHAPAQYDVLKPKVLKQLGGVNPEVILNPEVSQLDSYELSEVWKTSNLVFKDGGDEAHADFDEEEYRLSEIALKIMKDIGESGESNDRAEKRILKLQHVVDQLVEPVKRFTSDVVVGKKLEIRNDETRYFQTPCPPKFNIMPQIIKDTLAPHYVSVLETDSNVFEENVQEEADGMIEESVVYERMSAEESVYKERILNRQHHSAMEIRDYDRYVVGKGDSDDEAEKSSDNRFVSVLDMRRQYNKNRPGSALSVSPTKEVRPTYERSNSQPNFVLRKPVENSFLSDYNSVMKETQLQFTQMQSIKNDPSAFSEGSPMVGGRSHGGGTRASRFLKEDLFDKNAGVLTRSTSVDAFESHYTDYHQTKTLRRSCSANDLEQLDEELSERRETVGVDMTTWLKEEFWYQWIDELYPPDEFEEVLLSKESLASSHTSDDIANWIETLPKGDATMCSLIQEEISRLTRKIISMTSSSGLLGFHLCRRGACYRKLGELKNALDDLNRAIELEPRLVDAYWHRHLVFLVQDSTRKALEDLHYITLYNHTHTGAYRSRAEIYKQKGDTNLAISSYNQAISSDPKNAELYYARAELLEQRGEMLLAVDDYRSADMYEPGNTSAIKKIGMYHFNHGLWMIAVNDFTELLRKQTKNAEAYMFRARAWASVGKFSEAISDLSVSITQNPNNYLPFYYRGCYLRKCRPKQALQDLSVSLLLDSTVANVNSFLHRGILYMEMKRYDQATCDFQQAVRLNSRLAAAHVNLGVIEMLYNKNTHSAVKRFNVALRMDPTYIRAVICRAEAAEKVNDIDGAILDYTRAIHMKPDSIDLRMTRGRLLLKKNQLDLASFHIRQCAVMNDGKNASATQKAAVQTFLRNYDEAINVLELAVKSEPGLFGLLGRTRMKAGDFEGAIDNFNRALNLLKPWDTRLSWPKESAGIFFQIGMCYMELKKHRSALDSFNSSLKTDPTAEGYFNRGLVKMKLGLSKGMHDFNKALAYRPDYYQAYLGRAAFYGMSKRYAKAIMNCNEAIKIENKSIRAFLYRGAIKFKIKAYVLAIKDLSQAIEMDCTCSLAYFNRAVCFHEKRYYFHALKDYSIVLMQDCGLHMKALLNRGLLYFQIGDMENAAHDFVLALEADPDNPKIHHALGLCYHKLGDLQKAIQSYTNALQVKPFFSNALLGRGNVLMDYNQPLGNLLGKRDYVRAMHIDPLCMEARVNLAFSLQMQGYFKKAWNLFTRTIEIDPKYKSALEGRALVNLQMSNTFGAFVDMNSAININKTADSLTLRGVVNQFLGDRMSAMNDYQSARNLDPTHSLAYYNAANLYFLHRQFSQAISYYSKALDWNPNDGGAILNRAVAKTITGDYKSALDDFTEAEKLCPHWSHIYYNRGYLHFLNEKFELAEDDYTRALILQPDALLYKKRADARGKAGKKELALQDYRRSIYLQMKSNSKS